MGQQFSAAATNPCPPPPVGRAGPPERPFGRAGEAMLTTVVFLTALSLVIVGSITALVVREMRSDREFVNSVVSYYAAESGGEDVAYRIASGGNYSPTYNLGVGQAQAAVTTESAGNERRVTVRGDYQGRIRTIAANLNLTTSQARFHYGVQVGDGGLLMNNDSRVLGNVYSNGDISGGINTGISGDAVAAGRLLEPNPQWPDNDADCPFGDGSNRKDVVQSFTASASGGLHRVSILMSKVGNPPADLIVKINTDDNGQPSGTSLTSVTVPAAMVGSEPLWLEVPFVSPPPLVAGSKYWIVLETGTISPSDYWVCRKDSTDGYLGNTGLYASVSGAQSPPSRLFSWLGLGKFVSASGHRGGVERVSWAPLGGDISFKAWQAGENSRIEGLTIGDATQGSGRANLFVNTNIRGAACPNPYCIVDNPPREELPVSGSTIQQWRNEALAGGSCGEPLCDQFGNYLLDGGAAGRLGPLYVPGTFTVKNRAQLTVTGTIWVGGDVSLNNEAVIKLDPAYGPNSGVILTDSTASVNNKVNFQGSGTEGSYIMLLSAKNDPTGVVLDVNNDSTGVIYYAGNGRIRLNNEAKAREVTAYGLTMNNGATVIYESGLRNVNFQSGPGATFSIQNWQEV